ncbi:hypothetical protein GDO78_013290 [Eleutherodactylus coqui]|uniref:Uncharacterized protein n=1 Tax=Eleutherodactylus coqui TaxID=57060 RepID=A0A8J6K265_ELECQ|nr:hypothetical protein GDO78_013290 [Eleutherodactylus coqui]
MTPVLFHCSAFFCLLSSLLCLLLFVTICYRLSPFCPVLFSSYLSTGFFFFSLLPVFGFLFPHLSESACADTERSSACHINARKS